MINRMFRLGGCLSALSIGLLCLMPPAVAAGDATAGQKKNSMCIGCHGIETYKTAYPHTYSVPKIAGQHPQYIVKALQAYKSGERKHPTMAGIAASLNDQDMADLAAYYGQNK